ncbi:lysophospholipid acyltransferase family protein [candidate division WOR-3 bacterium]|nr:lysophospholipid acyltransferase family protein [candidate division WOR-3 bacterium]TET77510.1 MAG: hypothetical protein E3J41_06925 [Candidatus Cloacimonadota bacterium]
MFTTFYIIINFLSYILPMKLAYFITKCVVAGVYWPFYIKGRINVEKNLSYAFADRLKRWEKEKIIFETFQNFGLFLYEFLIIRKINQKTFRKFVNPVGFENIKKALKKGKGVIFLTGHLGNWEWGAALLTYLGHSPMVIAKRFKNRFITNYYFDRRQKQGMEVVYLDEAVRKSLRKLKNNGLVAIVGDRDYTNQGIEVPFFGKNTRFPTGAFLLAMRNGAAVIPTFAVRMGMCKYDVIFNSPLVIESSGYKAEDIKKNLMRWVKILESYIRRYPSQWYRFEPFWGLEKE